MASYVFMQFLFKGNLRQTKFALQDIIVLVFLQLTIVAFSWVLCKSDKSTFRLLFPLVSK